MFQKRSNYEPKPKTLKYKIPDALDSGIIEGFSLLGGLSDYYEKHPTPEKNLFKIFSIGYFIANVLKFIHGDKIDFEYMDPNCFGIYSPHVEKLSWHMLKSGVVQDSVQARVTHEFISTRYSVDLSSMMNYFPLFDGESEYFNHKLIQIIDVIPVLSSTSKEESGVNTNA